MQNKNKILKKGVIILVIAPGHLLQVLTRSKVFERFGGFLSGFA